MAVGFSGEESPDTLNFASVAFGHHFGPAVLVETGSPTAGEKSLNTLMQLAGYVGDAEPFRTSLRVEGQLWLADAMVTDDYSALRATGTISGALVTVGVGARLIPISDISLVRVTREQLR